ncbi:MAG: HAMP domain-containing sensor histidine kinase [Bacteroidia bacterium]|nr:HAMP domain-containing sensor histidine kinase [Bacteroidia bacterium]
MIYKSYYFNLVVRITLIVLTSLLLAFIWQFNDKPYTVIVISFLIVLQTYLLIRYNNKTNTELGKFFNALKDSDNTLNLTENSNSSFRELTKALNETFSALKDARLEKEKQFQFLKFISNQVGIGLLVLDSDSNTVLYNNEISNLLGINQPTSLKIIGKMIPELPPFLNNLKHGENQVFKTTVSQKYFLLVRSTQYTPAGESLRLFIFQDMKKEMEDTEIQTWQKMIRILSHEIMNSVTPVINLATASRNSLEKIKSSASFDKETIDNLNDVIVNNEIVEERIKGLSDFVIRYKNASAIPVPETGFIDVAELISQVINLQKNEIERLHIEILVNIDHKRMTIDGDKNLIEQVLINLLKNSVEALEKSEKKRVEINCYKKDQKTIIVISDNGEGISKENMERVFLPFFTTREKGSGIGLSLSRQIIRMHGGTLDIWSEPGEGTKVEIVL